MVALSSYYPTSWPANPFHVGEVQVQKRLGVEDHVNSYAPKVVRPYLPDQHQAFYSAQPFLVVAARDQQDRLWSTLLFASDPENVESFVSSPDPTRLVMESRPLPGDALEGALQPGSDLGIVGIEFASRRRNRVNGRILSNSGKSLEFKVDQSYGNCPQYIKPRDWWKASESSDGPLCIEPASKSSRRAHRLTPDQMEQIRSAESIFLATGYRGEGEDPRFGNDASHRGGQAGFIHVDDSGKKLILPDYSGNNHYNTIGNLMMDSSMGITIPLYETGGMIQLTGHASIHWDEEEHMISQFPGAIRLIEFNIQEIVEMSRGTLPIRWDAGNKDLKLQVYQKVQESDDVTSFYLTAIGGESPKLPSYKAGQHLTIALPAENGTAVSRSYSLSTFSNKNDHYRISVKRDPFGLVSRRLHDHIEVDDLVTIQKPAGDFAYQPSSKNGLVLFLSAGIGVTPILSMLHAFTTQQLPGKRAVWIQSARDGKHHPFKDEVEGLRKLAQDKVKTVFTYTRPNESDSEYVAGRVSEDLLAQFISPENGNVDVYMCGPNGFVGDMADHLQNLGVDDAHIQYETF